jgi:uncharacterized phage infection (PIP) family protein YhgE
MVKWWSLLIAAAVGAGVAVAIMFNISASNSADLRKQLDAALAANKPLRTSLDDAVSANHGLADELSKLQGQFDRTSKLLAADDATIARQQLTIAAGQRIVADIAASIAGVAGDLAKQIQAIADGFGRLYNLYHPNPSGSAKGPS